MQRCWSGMRRHGWPTGAAPDGLETTGNPIFVVPGSTLGAPGEDGGLPLGLQVLGFPQGNADVFAVARWIGDALRGRALESGRRDPGILICVDVLIAC
jgi:Asp-tRNA(Asn)/Glu-tRNA(Gln) amidotransferase A subunit family amidase